MARTGLLAGRDEFPGFRPGGAAGTPRSAPARSNPLLDRVRRGDDGGGSMSHEIWHPNWIPEYDRILAELWRAGMSTRQIAEQLSAENVSRGRHCIKITRDAVIGKARRLRLGTHPTRHKQEQPKMNDAPSQTGQAPADYVPSTSDARTTNNVMRHEYRVLSDNEKRQMQQIKDLGRMMHETFEAMGASRELSLAKTKVEEAVMWGVKHITR